MNIEIPPLGESITEAVIATWLKADGEWVDDGEEIVELETDKVTMPLPSPGAGILKHGAAEGDTIEVGGTVGELDTAAAKPEGAGEGAGDGAAATPAPAAESPAAQAKPEPAPAQAKPAPTVAAPASAVPADVKTTPLAEKLAGEHGLSLVGLVGTGAGGRIREQDVLAAVQAQASGMNGSAVATAGADIPAVAGGVPSRSIRTERMSQLRQRIAVRLVEAQQTAAMLTTFNECDMTNVMALRSSHKDAFLDAHGVKLGFMSFFVKAVCAALQKVPAVGAQLVDGAKGPELAYHEFADIAVAVGTDKGLVVPVVRNAESLSFAGVEGEILNLAKKARDGKLTLDDMTGGTFTISNGGVYGSMLSTPILNPPQSGILGMHNIIKRPVEHPDKPGEVAIRPMMYLALSYDHRIVDGEGAVTFLKTIKECIEDPRRLLLGV